MCFRSLAKRCSNFRLFSIPSLLYIGTAFLPVDFPDGAEQTNFPSYVSRVISIVFPFLELRIIFGLTSFMNMN